MLDTDLNSLTDGGYMSFEHGTTSWQSFAHSFGSVSIAAVIKTGLVAPCLTPRRPRVRFHPERIAGYCAAQ